jgi:hypothetical protein
MARETGGYENVKIRRMDFEEVLFWCPHCALQAN